MIRALVCDPQLVLADEPTGALDSHTSIEIMALLQQLNHEGVIIILAAGFAAIIGVFFGYYPARKASRLLPIDALRYE